MNPKFGKFLYLSPLCALLSTAGNPCLPEASAEPNLAARISHFQPVTSNKRQKSQDLNQDGVRLILRGEVKAGMKKIISAVKQDPANASALYNLAGIHLSHGEADKAVDVMEQAVSINDHDLDFQNRLGEAHVAHSNIDEAVGCFEKIVKHNASYEQALNRLGTLYAAQGRWRKAEETLLRAYKSHPNNPSIVENLSSAYLHQKKYLDVIKLSENLAEENQTPIFKDNLAAAKEALESN